ncbi:MAG: hypothetical protein IJW29_03235 [Clostridia bacterium]|nr:hypothetical protein [Clostridia bacterium]
MKRIASCALLALLILLMIPATPATAATTGAASEWVGADGMYTGEYAFSLAIVGDTQTMCNMGPKGGSSMPGMYQWIVDNVASKKIQYVLGLGDITEKGEDWGHKNNDTEAETLVGDKEWEYARNAIAKMDGVVPYSLVRGSGHDGLTRFNQWFADYTPYTDNIAGYMTEGDIGNVYHTFEANGTKYMILCLDFGTKDPAIEWAASVIEAHPEYKVIITTHSYMEADGSLLESGEAYCPSQSYYDVTNNDGEELWAKLIKNHENIFMVLCGHMSTDEVVISQVQGDHGNTVTQILIDPQAMDRNYAGGYGMVAMMYFSENGRDVAIEYYSTAKDNYRALKRVDLTHVHEYTSKVIEPTCTTSGTTRYTCEGCGDSYDQGYVNRLWHSFDDKYDTTCNRCDYTRNAPKRPETETKAPSKETEESGGGCSSGNSSAMATPLLFGGGAAALAVNVGRKKRKK